MKVRRTITAAALAALATTSFAATQAASAPDFDALPPTVEQVIAEVYRLNAGEADEYRLPVADAYRLDAGESEADNVVRTQFG